MSEKNTVAMFAVGPNDERIQIGWASPKNDSGIRTIEYSPGFDSSWSKDVSFADDEYPQEKDADVFDFQTKINGPVFTESSEYIDAPADAEPVEDAPDAEKSAGRVENAPDEELSDDPTDAYSQNEDD